jgi:hypothetical protein
MKNASSVNAPLILFCYNRLETLKKVISSLQSDHLTQNTDIFIFSDGPKSNSISDKSKVEEVRKYLDSLENFSKSLKIFVHKENLGLAKSIIYGIDKVSAQNESFIVLEDDLIISPYFLTYMNESLKKYADKKKVWTINGMGFNPNTFNVPKEYKYDTYFTFRNSSHGWGSWSDRWNKAILDHTVLRNEIFEINNQLDFNKGGKDLTSMLVNQLKGDIDSWSIKWSYTINKNDGVCLSPIYSYVSLIFAEGTHVKSYIESLDNNLDLSKRVVTYPEKVEVLTEIARTAAKVFHPKTPLLLKENIEQKSYYKKYLIRKKLLHENVKNKPYYKKYLIGRKLLSTNKYLVKKVYENENRWVRFLKSSYKNKLKIINKKLIKGLNKP